MRRTTTAAVLAAILVIPSAALAGTYAPTTTTQANQATSPLTGPACAPVGPGTNYPNTEVEPYLVVNPANTNIVVGTWQQDRYSDGAAKGSSVAVSSNGGQTFREIVVPGLTKCSGGTIFERASDPWLSYSKDGSILYAMSLVETKLPSGANNPSGMAVSRSLDNGLTWSNPTFVINDTDPTKFNDKNSLTADPTDNRFAYAIWDRLDAPIGKGSTSSGENAAGFRGPTFFTRTTDGGNTWEPARQIFNPGNNDQTIGNIIRVLPNGTLLDIFTLIRNDNKGKIKGLSVAVLRSTDKGATWSSTPTIVSTMSLAPVSDPDTGAAVRTGDLLPEAAVAPNGDVYVVWQDARFSGVSEVAMSRSTNGGTSWSAPTRISGSPGTQSFTPMIDVTRGGTVGVSYYDFRSNTAAAGLPTDVWLTHCHSTCTSGSNWTDAHAFGPFDMENAPVARGYFLGDYEGIATAGTNFLLLSGVAGSSPNTSDMRFVRMSA
jgi:hypothetical protein